MTANSQAHHAWRRASVAFIVLALIPFCLTLWLIWQLPQPYSWVAGGLAALCFLFLTGSLLSVCVAYALTNGWRSLLATTFEWLAYFVIPLLAVAALMSFLASPRWRTLAHDPIGALVAVGHIVGSIAVYSLLTVGMLALERLWSRRIERGMLEEAAVEFGVPVNTLNNPEVMPKFIKLLSARYSSELLRNRLSDLCGALLDLWAWLGWMSELAVLLAVIWYTATSSVSNAVYAWSIVAIAVIFWLIGVGFLRICKLLTGRFPGQAKQARKVLLTFINQSDAGASRNHQSVV